MATFVPAAIANLIQEKLQALEFHKNCDCIELSELRQKVDDVIRRNPTVLENTSALGEAERARVEAIKRAARPSTSERYKDPPQLPQQSRNSLKSRLGIGTSLRPGSASSNAQMSVAQSGINSRLATNAGTRLLTRHGLASGIDTKDTVGRQVKDASYWMALLRQKSGEVGVGVQRLSDEYATLMKEQLSCGALTRHHDTLSTAIGSLLNDLHVLNTILDACNTYDNNEAAINAIIDEQRGVTRRSSQMSEQLDHIYSQRSLIEADTNDIKNSIDEANNMIKTLPELLQDEWIQCSEKNNSDLKRIEIMRREIDEISAEADVLERRVMSNPHMARILNLQTDLQEAEQRQAEEQRLLEEARQREPENEGEFRAANKAATKELRAEEEIVREKMARADIIRSKMEAWDDIFKDMPAKLLEKYAQLVERDHHMTTFIEEFPDALAKTTSDTAQVGFRIVTKLSTMARDVRAMEAAAGLPVEAGDTTFNAAIQRVNKLLVGLRGRVASVEHLRIVVAQLTELEVSVRAASRAIDADIREMGLDMSRMLMARRTNFEFDKPGFNEKEERRKAKVRREVLSQQCRILEQRNDSLKAQLNKSDVNSALLASEERLRTASRATFDVTCNIARLEAASNYVEKKDYVLKIVHQDVQDSIQKRLCFQ